MTFSSSIMVSEHSRSRHDRLCGQASADRTTAPASAAPARWLMQELTRGVSCLASARASQSNRLGSDDCPAAQAVKVRVAMVALEAGVEVEVEAEDGMAVLAAPAMLDMPGGTDSGGCRAGRERWATSMQDWSSAAML